MKRATLILWAIAVLGCDENRGAMSEQVNGRCPEQPTVLTGTRTPGTACLRGQECQPICCPCANGGQSILFGSCRLGACEGHEACGTLTSPNSDETSHKCPFADAGTL